MQYTLTILLLSLSFNLSLSQTHGISRSLWIGSALSAPLMEWESWKRPLLLHNKPIQAADNAKLDLVLPRASKIDLLLYELDAELPIQTFHVRLEAGLHSFPLYVYGIAEGSYEILMMINNREVSSVALEIRR